MFDHRADKFCLVTSDSDFAYLCRKLLSKLRLNKQGLMTDLLTGPVRVNKEDIPHD